MSDRVEPHDTLDDVRDFLRSLPNGGPDDLARKVTAALYAERKNPVAHAEDVGLHKAEDIADHWHQRFLELRSEYEGNSPGEPELWNEMHCRAIGVKRLLDEIRAERKRLAQIIASNDK